jgi:hypothetical protein
MSFWDQTGDADGSTSGNYFSGDYEYDLEIESVKHRHGYKGEAVIVNVRVLTTNNPECPPGTGKSCAWNITKQPVLAINNIKSFVCGIYGWDDSKKGGEQGEKVKMVSKRMVEADNPLGGVKVHLTTFNKKTEKTKADFTVLDWAPYRADPSYVPPMPSATAGAAPAAPPPPPPATNGTAAAKAKALATPGWILSDGRWYDGTEWKNP